MTDLSIKATGTPAKLTVNYEDLKLALQEELKKADIVVTEETVEDSRKLAQSLNKLKAQIDTTRKDEVKKVSEPIDVFKKQMSDLMEMCTEAYRGIMDQVSTFDKQYLIEAADKLEAFYYELCEKEGLPESYRGGSPRSLAKKGCLTGKGNVTAATGRDIRAMVDEGIRKLALYNERMAALQDASDAAGLKTAVTPEDVKHIAHLPPEQYRSELESILASARRREEALDAQSAEPVESPVEPADPPPMEETVVELPEKDYMPITVTCVMKTRVHPLTLDAEVERQVRKKMSEAGFVSLHSVHIARQPMES